MGWWGEGRRYGSGGELVHSTTQIGLKVPPAQVTPFTAPEWRGLRSTAAQVSSAGGAAGWRTAGRRAEKCPLRPLR